MSKPTIHDVAREARVSISTVSRALNGQTTNENTIRRVRATAERLGYFPNAIAQSFKQQRLGQVAFAMEDIANPAYLRMFKAIEAAFSTDSTRLLLHSTNADRSTEVELVASLSRSWVDGLILCPLRVTDELIDRVLNAPVPVVIVGTVQGGAPVDFYGTDTEMATQIATAHLLAQGSTRIGYIGGPLDTRPGRERLAGYEAAMGMDPDAPLGESIEISQSFQFEDAIVAARTLIERYRPDGLVCVNDRVAMAAMRVLDELNLSVPTAVRVVSIDNSELSTMSHPGISSVDLFADKRGTLAANRLRARLAGTVAAGEVEQIVLEPSLVVRGSSA